MHDEQGGSPRPVLRATMYDRSAVEKKREGVEAEPLWPSITDPYKAAGTPDSHEIPRLVVVMGRDRFKPGDRPAYYTLQYAYIGKGEYGFGPDGQWFRIPFHEPDGKVTLKARGRNIFRHGDHIALRRLPWIRLADRDFRTGDGQDADVSIFTHIEVEVEEK